MRLHTIASTTVILILLLISIPASVMGLEEVAYTKALAGTQYFGHLPTDSWIYYNTSMKVYPVRMEFDGVKGHCEPAGCSCDNPSYDNRNSLINYTITGNTTLPIFKILWHSGNAYEDTRPGFFNPYCAIDEVTADFQNVNYTQLSQYSGGLLQTLHTEYDEIGNDTSGNPHMQYAAGGDANYLSIKYGFGMMPELTNTIKGLSNYNDATEYRFYYYTSEPPNATPPNPTGIGAVNITGYVMDGSTATVISGADVNASQAGYWYNTTTPAGGDYTLEGIQKDKPVTFTAAKTGYTHTPFYFTPFENITYHIDLIMFPDYIPNNTAIVGFTYTTWSHDPINAATVSISNATWSDTVTTNAAGYYIFDNLLAGGIYTVSATATSHQDSADYDVTTVSDATVQQDIALEANYVLTVYARDMANGAPLTGVDVFVQLSDGQNTNTSFGFTTFHVDGGLITVTGTATGYTAAQQQAVVTGDTSITLLFSKISEQSQVSYYMQKVVRIKAVDAYGVPLVGANISVNYIASTLPSTNITWLVAAFGISQQVATEMTTSSLAMTGLTVLDGAANFVMFPALTYGITVSNSTLGLNHYTTLTPQDNDYTIYCALPTQGAPNSTQMQFGNTTLFITEPTTSTVTFNMIYYDVSGLTTNLKFNVSCWDNQTSMYYYDFGNVGSRVVSDSNYTVPNVKGQEWRFWYNATRSAPV